MRLLEYQGKELFDQYGIRIPRSHLANNIQEARQGGKKLGYPLVLKSQLTVGGRGKAGAIVKCKSEAELERKAARLKTHLRARGVRLLRYDDLGADDKGIVRHPDRDIAWFADPAGNIHSVARLKTPLPQRPA